jgi:hypothetical protein
LTTSTWWIDQILHLIAAQLMHWSCCGLLTVQVELGGWLGERSWLRPFADALGWVDAYVERMLMAVILVKDEVRQGADTCITGFGPRCVICCRLSAALMAVFCTQDIATAAQRVCI